MNKSLLNRLFAMFMALLILLSATGFSVDAHYCQGHLKSISLFGKAKPCHSKQDISPCHQAISTCHHTAGVMSKVRQRNCCHNKTLVIKKSNLDATKTNLIHGVDNPSQLVAQLLPTILYDFIEQVNSKIYPHYKPPLIESDIQELYQIFLI